MGALFTACDRPVYQRLVPQHIYDLLTLPLPILSHLHAGGFAVRFTTTEWHAVAIDECHEMKINKDAKMAVVRPTPEKMTHLSNYLPFRAACLNNFTDQLFPERKDRTVGFSHKPTSKDEAANTNVEKMVETISGHGMFHTETENEGLWNIFESRQATAEQTHDLMNLREIGQTAMDNYISCTVLKKPSTEAPVRKKRLVTFTQTKVAKQRVKQVERERKLMQKYLR